MCDCSRLFALKQILLLVFIFVIRLERCFQCVKNKNNQNGYQKKKGKYKVSKRRFGHYLFIHILKSNFACA